MSKQMLRGLSSLGMVLVISGACLAQVGPGGGGAPPPNLDCIVNEGVTACATDQISETEGCPLQTESSCNFGGLCKKYLDKDPTCQGTIDGEASIAVAEQVIQMNHGSATHVPVFVYEEEDEESSFPVHATDLIACYSKQKCKCVPITNSSDFRCERDGSAVICSLLRLTAANGPCPQIVDEDL